MPFVVVAFFALVVLPPVLMASAHVYAIRAQDKGTWYVVSLDPRVRSVTHVVADQTERYKLSVTQTWDSPTAKGYSAFMSTKRLEALRNDRRVINVELRDEGS